MADAGVFEEGGVVVWRSGRGEEEAMPPGVGEVAGVLEEVGVADFFDEVAGFEGGAAVLVGDDVCAGVEVFVGDCEGGGEVQRGGWRPGFWGVLRQGAFLPAVMTGAREDGVGVEFGAFVVEEVWYGDTDAGEGSGKAVVEEAALTERGADVDSEDMRASSGACAT